MAAFGAGATIGAVGLNRVSTRNHRQTLLVWGCILLTSVMLLAQGANLWSLMALWALAGVGQSVMDVSTQMLIADRISVELQGRVYGAHFAWSHLWWVMAYPIAGLLSQSASQSYFLMSGTIGLGGLAVLGLVVKCFPSSHQGFWHEHGHSHLKDHVHIHSFVHASHHSHYHFHLAEHSIDSVSNAP